MPITLDYLNINNNPSSQRLRKHIASVKVYQSRYKQYI